MQYESRTRHQQSHLKAAVIEPTAYTVSSHGLPIKVVF